VCLLLLGGCAPPRDVVPESHDVQRTPSAGAEGGYEYVARRPLAVVAIAESRGLDHEVVTGIADRLANSLDVCATQLASEGRLVPAAARIAAHIDRAGAPTGLALTLTPGPGPTANALVCFVSPFKLLHFPAADVDPQSRGLAVEAAWGGSAIGVPTSPPAAPEPPR
jgi:hypothetical protein